MPAASGVAASTEVQCSEPVGKLLAVRTLAVPEPLA